MYRRAFCPGHSCAVHPLVGSIIELLMLPDRYPFLGHLDEGHTCIKGLLAVTRTCGCGKRRLSDRNRAMPMRNSHSDHVVGLGHLTRHLFQDCRRARVGLIRQGDHRPAVIVVANIAGEHDARSGCWIGHHEAKILRMDGLEPYPGSPDRSVFLHLRHRPIIGLPCLSCARSSKISWRPTAQGSRSQWPPWCGPGNLHRARRERQCS